MKASYFAYQVRSSTGTIATGVVPIYARDSLERNRIIEMIKEDCVELNPGSEVISCEMIQEPIEMSLVSFLQEHLPKER